MPRADTPAEVAALLQVSERTVRRLVASSLLGRAPGLRQPTIWRAGALDSSESQFYSRLALAGIQARKKRRHLP